MGAIRRAGKILIFETHHMLTFGVRMALRSPGVWAKNQDKSIASEVL